MPPMLQKTIREIHQRLRALETREYAEVVGPGSVINAQYLTLALHAILTAERRFVAGDGLVGTDAGANADYTLDVDLVAAWSGLEFAAGELRVDLDAAFLWAGAHTFNANIALGAGITIDGMDPSAFMVTYAAHDHSPGDPTQVDHANLANVLANQHHAEVHVVNSTGPHAEAGLAVGNVLRASGAAAFAFAQLQHGDLGGVGADDHHAEVHVVNSTGPHAEGGLAVGNVLRASAAAAFAFAQLQHGDLGGVGVNDHHNEVHVVNSTGPHAEAGLTIGHVLRASGAAAFAFAQLQHGDLGGVGAGDHHAQIHNVVGADHTLTGAQWNLVGATALNTIGLLLPLSDVSGPAEAILKSNATGDLTVHDLTATGQLSAGAGIAEGLILGADAQWYRDGADELRTPDSVTIDVALNVGTATAAVLPGQIKALNNAVNTTADFYGFIGIWTKTAGATDNADDFFGLYTRMTLNDAADDIGDLFGGQIEAVLTDGVVGVGKSMIGLRVLADGDGGTVYDDVIGLDVVVDLEAGMTSIGDDVFGIKIVVDADEIPIGSVYMLYLNEASNVNYGIFQNGTALNVLGGDLILGAEDGGGRLNFDEGTTIADGIVWGSDANKVTLYRSADDMLKTDDSLTVALGFNVGTTGAAAGQIKLSGSIIYTMLPFDIRADTADGFDTKRAGIAGGGLVGVTRGSGVFVYGNEHAETGKVLIRAGDVVGGEIHLETQALRRMTIARDGTVTINQNLNVIGSHRQSVSIGVRAYRNVDFIHNNTGNWLAIPFTHQRWDDPDNDQWAVAPNPTRLTCQFDGIYVITGCVQWAANATGRRILRIRLNGTTTIATQSEHTLTAHGCHQVVTTTYEFSVGDYVELHGYQDSGGNLNILATGNTSPEFSMVRVA